MMSIPDETKLNRFLNGFRTPDEMQEPPGRDGDPQLAALTQFLQTTAGGLGPEDVILDIGSGRGILATTLLRIWGETQSLPWYYAVDREPIIEALNLPPSIHNHSRKVHFVDFLAGKLPHDSERIKMVVLRNILHELDITTTAEIFLVLRRIVPIASQIYIQDIVSLPKGEREKAGWHPDILRIVLERMGFHCGIPADYVSHSGTPWFTVILQNGATDGAISHLDASLAVADGREKQLQRSVSRLAELGNDTSEETLAEFVMLSAEVAALTTQLQMLHYTERTPRSRAADCGGIPLISLRSSTLDYAEVMPSSVRARSGLRGILSSKNVIDLPVLIQGTSNRLWFAGYSQRLLFKISAIRTALKAAVAKGVDVRILLVDPYSAAALARGRSEVYERTSNLSSDILETCSACAELVRELREESVAETNEQFQVELRLCQEVLSSSYFFADDICICSLYSSSIRGGSGTAFVFGSSSLQPTGYFQVLLRDFQNAWGQSKRGVL